MQWLKEKMQEKSLEEQISSLEENNFSLKTLEDIIPLKKEKYLVNIPSHVFSDLEFFKSNDEKGKCLLSSLKKTQTPYGEFILRHLLQTPLENKEEIENRRWIINKIYTSNFLFNSLKESFNNLKNSEDVLWFWKPEDDSFQALYDMVYYKTPFISEYINKSELFLFSTSLYKMFISPGFAILTPILCFLFPYLLLRYMGLNVSLFDIFHLLKGTVFSVSFLSNKTATMALVSFIVWFALYGYNIYTICQYSSLTNNVSNIIHRKLKSASDIISISSKILQITQYYPVSIKNNLEIENCNLETEILLLNPTILADISMFRNKGCILSTYWKIRSCKDDLAKRIKLIGYFDAYYTIVSYLKEMELKGLRWCYPKYGKSIKVEKMWHPILAEKAVPNDIKFKKNTNTILLTGPNAAGKSTFVRTFLVNCLFSQSLGIAFASKWQMKNTYLYLDTFLNVPDSEGYSSLFQAEMFRCEELLNSLRKLKENGNSRAIIALDEVFSSTNFKEGYSAAYAIIKHIADKYPELICFVTTHFHGLTDLQKITRNKVRNYCLSIDKNMNYTFKIKKGVSTEHIALDLLEKKGFSKDILQTARKIYSELH